MVWIRTLTRIICKGVEMDTVKKNRKDDRKQVTLRIPQVIKERLIQAAIEKEMPLNQLAVQILRQELSRHEFLRKN